MNKYLTIIYVILIALLFSACTSSDKNYDASGSFEAIERIISAQATGKIVSLDIEEGQVIAANDSIGRIDVSKLVLQLEQVQAGIDALDERKADATPQIDILKAQLTSQESQTASLRQQIVVLDKEIARFGNLVAAKAVPQKQLDDLTGQKTVLNKQLEAAAAQAGVIRAQIGAATKNANLQNRSILSAVEPNEKQMELIEEQISDGTIINEHPGTILTQYAYDGEFTSIGKPLYKIADLSEIILRVYLTGNQLAQVKINDEVRVFTDDRNDGFKETQGTIMWISSKAEFTPKTIQTKDERANLVYATKIKVANDGTYKIGMYGEIKFLH